MVVTGKQAPWREGTTLTIIAIATLGCSALAEPIPTAEESLVPNTWVQRSNTIHSDPLVLDYDEHHNTTGSPQYIPWSISKQSIWYVLGSEIEGPPTWDSEVATLQQNAWWEDASGWVTVPDGWFCWDHVEAPSITGQQIFEDANDPNVTIFRSVNHTDWNVLTEIVSEMPYSGSGGGN